MNIFSKKSEKAEMAEEVRRNEDMGCNPAPDTEQPQESTTQDDGFTDQGTDMGCTDPDTEQPQRKTSFVTIHSIIPRI